MSDKKILRRILAKLDAINEDVVKMRMEIDSIKTRVNVAWHVGGGIVLLSTFGTFILLLVGGC